MLGHTRSRSKLFLVVLKPSHIHNEAVVASSDCELISAVMVCSCRRSEDAAKVLLMISSLPATF